MKDLRETLREHKEEYLRYLMDLTAIDTHDLGHGILGGLEKAGQDMTVTLLWHGWKNRQRTVPTGALTPVPVA